jgi:glucan phosphoethanolaminetransferase (alkaline phosphatase superfamily)
LKGPSNEKIALEFLESADSPNEQAMRMAGILYFAIFASVLALVLVLSCRLVYYAAVREAWYLLALAIVSVLAALLFVLRYTITMVSANRSDRR